METLRDAENQIDKIHSISAIETVNISISSIEMANVNNIMNYLKVILGLGLGTCGERGTQEGKIFVNTVC
mgnify:CR=1 FL=1